MTLSTRILIFLLFIFLLYSVFSYAAHRYMISPRFASLERNEAQKDLLRCVEAIRREIHYLDMLTNDWATWDDTYQFIQNRNAEYIASNLGFETFIDTNLNIIYFLDASGRVIWGDVRDLNTQDVLHLRDFSLTLLAKTHPLLQHSTLDSSITGLYMTEKGPLAIASRPIITSARKGPIKGCLIMGRFLSKDFVKHLVEQTRVDLKIWPIVDGVIPEDDRNALNALNEATPYFFVENDKFLNVYATYADLKGTPALLIKAIIPREISSQGLASMRLEILLITLVGIVLLIALMALLQRYIINPISALTAHAVKIRDSNDLALRYSSNRNDEIGVLAREFDRMVRRLHDVQQGLETLIVERTADLTDANRRLHDEIAVRTRAEKALVKAHENLERLVEVRTSELVEANKQLEKEIAERKQSEKELHLYHAKLRSLSSELLLTEERERRKIATDLHDRIGQTLTISRIKLDELMDNASSDISADLSKIGEWIEQTIQDTRQLTFELSPPILYELGLEAALGWLTDQFQEQHSLTIKLRYNLQPEPPNNIFRVLIFQSVRELLFNIAKHAAAKKAKINITGVIDEIRIDITDDGIGFDTEKIGSQAHRNIGFGLFSIRERLQHLNGRIEVKSELGQGTHISMFVPINSN